MNKLIHVISDSNIGGAGRYLLAYLGRYDRRKYRVTAVVPTGSKLTAQIEEMGVRVLQVKGLAERSVSFEAAAALYRIFRREKPDLVHTHASVSARLAARLARVGAVVYTRHSVFPQKAYLTSQPGRAVNGLAARLLCDGVIAVAEAAKGNLTDTGIAPERVRVIYNGVEEQKTLSDQEKGELRRKFDLSDDEFVVAIIARLEPVKGHLYFIEAAKLVKEAGAKARFVIAGTGGCEQELIRRAAELGLEDTVSFTGFLSNIAELENVMDIQANASYGTEAASLSLLEGMSLGKPAVVSDFGGNPELIENGVNGFVVPEKNAAAMAEAILRLYHDRKLLREMAGRSAEIYKRRFTARTMTENMERFYEEILKKRRSHLGVRGH